MIYQLGPCLTYVQQWMANVVLPIFSTLGWYTSPIYALNKAKEAVLQPLRPLQK
jgi:hypothetical protein